MQKSLYNTIEKYMNSCIKESAHDKSHVYRVLNYALLIAESEKDVDYDVLIASALLHDIGRDNKLKKHNEIGAEMAKSFLNTIDFPKEKIEQVYHAVFCHNNSSYGKQQTLEAKILYDADKLDAVGVIGIARTLVGVGNYNNPMYSLKNGKVDLDENSDTDTFIRYYQKHINKNYDRFYTETAKNISAKMRNAEQEYFKAFTDTVNDNCSYGKLLLNHIE